jgi:twinkle protein
MDNEREDSEFIKHLPCTTCTSSDGMALYSDGHTHCFVCNTTIHADDSRVVSKKSIRTDLLQGEAVSLPKRKLTLETCKKWNYKVADYNGEKVQVATYYDKDKKPVFQKLRFKDKQFKTLGDINQATLYGQNLWNSGGKILCICEGEVDTASLSQLFNHKYAVCGIPNGVNGAVKSLKKQLEFLESFESVIFFMDQDEPGQECAKKCAELLSVGKAKIASFELKDVNEMLVHGLGADVIKAMWEAKTYRPDGVVAGEELWEVIKKEDEKATAFYPYEGLNRKLFGIRKREIVTICGGSGIGKSLMTKEIAYHLIKEGKRIGIISLEESLKRTCEGIIGLHLNKPIHIDRDNVTETELQQAYKETIGNGNVFLYDHWGSVEENTIINKIKYFAKALDIEYLFIDHISIIVSGLETNDERKTIDLLMTRLRALTEQLNIGVIIISHLKRPEGNKDHTDGLKTSLGQLRGSGSIGQLCDICVGVERSVSSADESKKTVVRILKNRFAGITGVGTTLQYNTDTGRLLEYEQTNNF